MNKKTAFIVGHKSPGKMVWSKVSSSINAVLATNKSDCCTTVEKASLAMTVDIFVDNSDLRLKI